MATVSKIEFDLTGISPLSFGRAFQTDRPKEMEHSEYDKTYWREKCHVAKSGQVFVPPMMAKKAIESAAQYLSETVPGKGSSKYTKHFKSGILVVDPILLFASGKPIMIDAIQCERHHVAADGVAGSTKRVWRTFPYIPDWSGTVQLHLLDPLLQQKIEVVERYISHAGQFIGLGRFSPRRGGFYGRYVVTEFRRFAGDEQIE